MLSMPVELVPHAESLLRSYPGARATYRCGEWVMVLRDGGYTRLRAA